MGNTISAPVATDDPYTWLPWTPEEEREEQEQEPPATEKEPATSAVR
ncbi:hypothetical protein GCM10010344_28610 [Streptomyces bluensis]|nr:hypothetical protein GCM10010344_28610 [Streptomyces bluensis]